MRVIDLTHHRTGYTFKQGTLVRWHSGDIEAWPPVRKRIEWAPCHRPRSLFELSHGRPERQ